MIKKTESWTELENHMHAIDRLRTEYDAHNRESEYRIKTLEAKIAQYEQKRVRAIKELRK